MQGRKPVPTALKLIRGKPGHRPLPKDEPKPEIKIPPCPRHLSAEARKEWKRVSKVLARLGMLSTIDRAALAAYCQAWGRWVDAERHVKERGEVVKTAAGNIIQNPYLCIANKSMEQMYKFLTEFGMTPVSRTRVTAAKQ